LPIFISYSHSDSDFVDKLAAELVRNNAHVWVDRWELNVGDSILNNVQKAIQDSSALLIVLSKASVASEWCKKELSAGLMRELDEKRVVVLPVVVEDCEIPVFLREKLYADFRKSFEPGFRSLMEAVSRITTTAQGRLPAKEGYVDWSETWGYEDDRFWIDFTLIEAYNEHRFSILTDISIHSNDVVTKRYLEYEKQGIDWLGRLVITEALSDLANAQDIKVLLNDQRPAINKYFLRDTRMNAEYRVIVKCRRMGEDNGKDQLVHIGNYLARIRDYVRNTARRPSAEELALMLKLMAHN
jgi:hypothetical protein